MKMIVIIIIIMIIIGRYDSRTLKTDHVKVHERVLHFKKLWLDEG